MLEKALKYANQAIAVQPGDAFVQFIFGFNLALLGKPNEAITLLKEAIRLDPAEPSTPYLKAIINEMNQAYPNYSPEKWLAKWHKSDAALNRTMTHLYRWDYQGMNSSS